MNLIEYVANSDNKKIIKINAEELWQKYAKKENIIIFIIFKVILCLLKKQYKQKIVKDIAKPCLSIFVWIFNKGYVQLSNPMYIQGLIFKDLL